MKNKQRIKKLEESIHEKEPKEFVTILGLVKAEIKAEEEGNDEELQRLLKILRKNPHQGKPIGYEKYFKD